MNGPEKKKKKRGANVSTWTADTMLYDGYNGEFDYLFRAKDKLTVIKVVIAICNKYLLLSFFNPT